MAEGVSHTNPSSLPQIYKTNADPALHFAAQPRQVAILPALPKTTRFPNGLRRQRRRRDE